MLSVAEATERITRALVPVARTEIVPLAEADGRALALPVNARRPQPPDDISAMDGYALRGADAETLPTRLKVVGSVPAGGWFEHAVGAGEAVRIFTGAPLPRGADTVVIQENTERHGDIVLVREGAVKGKHVRKAGLDFPAGAPVLEPPRRLSPLDLSLAAAAGAGDVTVKAKPRIAILATGDELVRPGEPTGPSQIYASSVYGLSAMLARWGAQPIDLGIAKDERESLLEASTAARGADMFVTLGGASVGEHDLVQTVLGEAGLKIDFWKIAMRPGKPLMFGWFGDMPMMGLPGNPVSALVCALLFLKPAVEALLGLPALSPSRLPVQLGSDLPANDTREDYLRACITRRHGQLVATPFPVQDSSMLSSLANAQGLIVRPPKVPAARRGERAEAILLTPDLFEAPNHSCGLAGPAHEGVDEL